MLSHRQPLALCYNCFTLQAETEEERAEWVAAIQGVIAALLMLPPEDHATLAEVSVPTPLNHRVQCSAQCPHSLSRNHLPFTLS
jgi:hypothetical protein